MKPGLTRTVALSLLLSLSGGLLAPSLAVAAEAPLVHTQGTVREDLLDAKEEVSAKLAGKIYTVLRKVFLKVLDRANKSARIDLRLNFSFLDDHERMLFDVGGTVRVKVGADKARAEFQRMLEKEETKVVSTNGPISIDCAVTPLKIEGDEVLFGVQLDVAVLTHAIFQQLVRSAAQVGSFLAINVLAGKAIEALTTFSTDTAGQALEMGIENLPPVIGAEAGAITYAAFQDQEHSTWKERLKATLTPGGLLKHFALAAIFAGVKGGAQAIGLSVGAAVGASLIPGGGTFLSTLLTTSALIWFGNHVVHTVGVKWPVLWKLAKIGRLYRKAFDSEGGRRERLSNKYAEYHQNVLDKVLREMESGYKRWVFLELLIKYFRSRVRDRGALANNIEGFDLVPYQPLVDGLAARLQFRMSQGKDWYAARMYYQLLDAVNQLPEGHDHRPLPGDILREAAAGASKSREDGGMEDRD